MRKWFAVLVTSATIAGGILVAETTPAAADQTWTQSFERPSATAPCVAPADETPWQEGWTGTDRSWTPTWEQWPNGGRGGWTCTRSITWAKDTPPPAPPQSEASSGYPSAGCVRYNAAEYLNFDGGYTVGKGIRTFANPACTIPGLLTTADWFVFAPAPFNPQTMCDMLDPGTTATNFAGALWDPDLYACD